MHFTFNEQPEETFKIFNTRSFQELFEPVKSILPKLTPLKSRGNRPLQLDFEHHIKALI
jgi:hypothetical protein